MRSKETSCLPHTVPWAFQAAKGGRGTAGRGAASGLQTLCTDFGLLPDAFPGPRTELGSSPVNKESKASDVCTRVCLPVGVRDAIPRVDLRRLQKLSV